MRKCQCSIGCRKQVKYADRFYALGHNPNSHMHEMPHNMTKKIRRKISTTLKARWDALSQEGKLEMTRPLMEGNKAAWKDRIHKRIRVANMSKGVREYCRTHKDEVQDVLTKINDLITRGLADHWKWIIVPLAAEHAVAVDNWYEKEEHVERGGLWVPKSTAV